MNKIALESVSRCYVLNMGMDFYVWETGQLSFPQ